MGAGIPWIEDYGQTVAGFGFIETLLPGQQIAQIGMRSGVMRRAPGGGNMTLFCLPAQSAAFQQEAEVAVSAGIRRIMDDRLPVALFGFAVAALPGVQQAQIEMRLRESGIKRQGLPPELFRKLWRASRNCIGTQGKAGLRAWRLILPNGMPCRQTAS